MKFRLTILFSIFYLWLHAQTKVVSSSFFFGTKLKIEKYSGNDFRYTLDAKSRQTDSLKNITILARQVINSDEWLDVNMTKDVSADTSWKKLATTGRINPKSKEIWLYVTIEGNGIFLTDNIKFEIRNNQGNWIETPIKNSNFENDADNPLKSFLHSPKIPEGTRINALNLNDHLHGKVLEIETTKAKLTWRTFYGNNRTTGKYCLVNGIKLYYETYGKGEPLLLLHGNGQSIAAFSKQIPDFEKKYKVIAVDTRAQGKSLDNDTTKLSYDLFASDMKVLLDSLHLKKVNIVGWSDGGNTALIMAIKYPEYVNRLMITGANLNPTEQAVDKAMLAQVRKDLKELIKKDDAESQQVARLLKMLLAEPNIDSQDLHKITASCLIMAGEKDIIKQAHTKLIADNINNSKLVIFKNESHMVPEENAKMFNQTVLNFLSEGIN